MTPAQFEAAHAARWRELEQLLEQAEERSARDGKRWDAARLRAADFLPFLYFAGSLALLLRPDGKRLGDLAAGTLVVYSEPARLHAAIPAAEPRAPARPRARTRCRPMRARTCRSPHPISR